MTIRKLAIAATGFALAIAAAAPAFAYGLGPLTW